MTPLETVREFINYLYWLDKDAIEHGNNVAVVFRGPLPKTWANRRVIDGDRDDLRFLDPMGVIVGLKAKGRAKHDESGFVVD